MTNGKFILPIECKKTKEIQTFLIPQGALAGLIRSRDVADFRCLRTTYSRVHDGMPVPNRIGRAIWQIWPVSPSSEFCIVSTSTSGKDQRLLEKIRDYWKRTLAYCGEGKAHALLFRRAPAHQRYIKRAHNPRLGFRLRNRTPHHGAPPAVDVPSTPSSTSRQATYYYFSLRPISASAIASLTT